METALEGNSQNRRKCDFWEAVWDWVGVVKKDCNFTCIWTFYWDLILIILIISNNLCKGSAAVAELADPWSSSFYCFLSPTYQRWACKYRPQGGTAFWSSSPKQGEGAFGGNNPPRHLCACLSSPQDWECLTDGMGFAPHFSGPQGWSLEDAQRRLLELSIIDLERCGVGSVCMCAHTHMYICLKTRFLLRSIWMAVPRVANPGGTEQGPSKAVERRN